MICGTAQRIDFVHVLGFCLLFAGTTYTLCCAVPLLPISEEPAEGRSSRTQIPQTLVVEVSRAASPEKPTEPLEEAQSRGIPQREESRAGQVEGASTRIDILAPVESPSWLASLQQQTKYQGMGGVSGEQKRKEVAQTSNASDFPKKARFL